MKTLLILSAIIALALSKPLAAVENAEWGQIKKQMQTDEAPEPAGKTATNWSPASPAICPAYIAGRIIYLGRKDVGRNLGDWNGECKVWLQEVVKQTTGILLPLNAGSHWQPDYSGRIIGQSGGIDGVQRGHILQMQMKGRDLPHTAIVIARSGDYMWWLDSNYVAKNTVGIHYERISKFKREVAGYSIYTITH